MLKYNKIEKSWILYDCTISTYSMIIITTILPIYSRMVFENVGGSTAMLIALLFTQIVAFTCAIIFCKLSEKFTAKIMLYAGIIIYSIICIYANFVHNAMGFWILAMLVATSQGGIQALSRSYFGKLVPKEKNNEFFGFYNIFGRFAAILGPFMVALATQVTGKASNGIFSILILFIAGGLILTRVSEVENSNESMDEENMLANE